MNRWNTKHLQILKRRDRFKKEQCKKNDILLIAVPYWIPKGKWETGIQKKLYGFLKV